MTVTTVSVFTPSHNSRWLDDCYASLKAQSRTDWEWIVVLNGGAQWSIPEDDRVKVTVNNDLSGVGACKQFACSLATGDILVELDHDDVLESSALVQIAQAFEDHPQASLVYSDFAQVTTELTGEGSPPFGPEYGWTFRPVFVSGNHLIGVNAMDASYPHNNGLIWFAPNHVRAFRRTAYDQVGGYDPALDVLDDQDLMSRLFVVGEFVHIPECLYLQRAGDHNTQRQFGINQRIQDETWFYYERYIGAMLEAWCERQGLHCIDISDAEDPLALISDYHTCTVGGIRSIGAIEREPNRIAMWREMHRVLAHGGMVLSMFPSTDGNGAFADPWAMSHYNEALIRNLLRIPMNAAAWRESRVRSFYPTSDHQRDGMMWVQANLIADKGGPRQGGLQVI